MDAKPGQIGLDDKITPPVPVGLPADAAELHDWSPAGKRATSIEAFERLYTSGKRVTAAMKVYDALVTAGQIGLTAERVGQALKMKTQTVTARLWDLTRAGLIYREGDTRPTESGGKAYVYRVTAKAWPESGSITARPVTASGKRTQQPSAPVSGGSTPGGRADSVAASLVATHAIKALDLATDPVKLSPLSTSPLIGNMLAALKELRQWLGEVK